MENGHGAALAPPQAGYWQRLLQWLRAHRYVLAPLSFGAGLASFLLIERQEWLAQWLSVLLVLTWLLALAEGGRLRLPPALLRFGTQAVHQEVFFFTLPFFLHTTTWASGQAVFTATVVAAAAASMWDPLYFGAIAARPWRYLAFHAFAVFAATLTIGPILLHLTTGETVGLAALAIALLALPSLAQVIDRQRALHWFVMVGGAAALGALAWAARPWVPPATLWLERAAVTHRVETDRRAPGLPRTVVTAGDLHAHGLYAFTAIRAPRGLRERVYHRWLHHGREVDRIALEIVGGRAEGYRAWSHKLGFPADARGAWRVEIVTEGGQLVGAIEFRVD